MVSLTSYGCRIQSVDQVIEILKAQSLAPAKIILWLSEDEFPEKLHNLPDKLAELQDDHFAIRFCKDLKSFKKLVPTLRLHEDRIIVTADDDQHYKRHWLWELFQGWIWKPNHIHCHRTHKLVFSFGQLDNCSRWLYNHKQKEASGLLFPHRLRKHTLSPFLLYARGFERGKIYVIIPNRG